VSSIDECVPHSGRLRGPSANPPATSTRLSHRVSASGALFSPSPPAFAFGSGRHPSSLFRGRVTRSALPRWPFGPRCVAGGWSVVRRLLQSRSSDPRAPPTNRPIPAGSITSIDTVFCGPAGVDFVVKAETLTRAFDSVAGLLSPSQGPAPLSRAPAESPRVENFRPLASTTPLLPRLRCSQTPLVAEHVVRSGLEHPSLTSACGSP
jgi:hypothetical protein